MAGKAAAAAAVHNCCCCCCACFILLMASCCCLILLLLRPLLITYKVQKLNLKSFRLYKVSYAPVTPGIWEDDNTCTCPLHDCKAAGTWSHHWDHKWQKRKLDKRPHIPKPNSGPKRVWVDAPCFAYTPHLWDSPKAEFCRLFASKYEGKFGVEAKCCHVPLPFLTNRT